jgi:hypothetical protein
MRYWKLSHEDIERALLDPDRITPSQSGRSNAWKLLDSNWLRITFIDELDKRVIITVTVRDKGPD